MNRFKERLFSKNDEIGDNGVSIRNADVDGVLIKENGNERHFVYLYYSEIPNFIKMLNKKYKDHVKRCNHKDKEGNRQYTPD